MTKKDISARYMIVKSPVHGKPVLLAMLLAMTLFGCAGKHMGYNAQEWAAYYKSRDYEALTLEDQIEILKGDKKRSDLKLSSCYSTLKESHKACASTLSEIKESHKATLSEIKERPAEIARDSLTKELNALKRKLAKLLKEFDRSVDAAQSSYDLAKDLRGILDSLEEEKKKYEQWWYESYTRLGKTESRLRRYESSAEMFVVDSRTWTWEDGVKVSIVTTAVRKTLNSKKYFEFILDFCGDVDKYDFTGIFTLVDNKGLSVASDYTESSTGYFYEGCRRTVLGSSDKLGSQLTSSGVSRWKK